MQSVLTSIDFTAGEARIKPCYDISGSKRPGLLAIHSLTHGAALSANSTLLSQPCKGFHGKGVDKHACAQTRKRYEL